MEKKTEKEKRRGMGSKKVVKREEGYENNRERRAKGKVKGFFHGAHGIDL